MQLKPGHHLFTVTTLSAVRWVSRKNITWALICLIQFVTCFSLTSLFIPRIFQEVMFRSGAVGIYNRKDVDKYKSALKIKKTKNPKQSNTIVQKKTGAQRVTLEVQDELNQSTFVIHTGVHPTHPSLNRPG